MGGAGPRRNSNTNASSLSSLSSSKRTSSVNRKQSKSKLVAGEVKAAQLLQSSVEQQEQQRALIKLYSQQQSKFGAPNDQQLVEQQQGAPGRGEPPLDVMYQNLPDPLTALPSSQTKKYPTRQLVSWSGPSSASSTNSNVQPQFSGNACSPSPSQSEYESCDQWD